MNALPETDCKPCLRVRSKLGELVIVFETAASRALGLNVGDTLSPEQGTGHMLCMDVPQVSRADIERYMADLKMTPAKFAAAFGISEDQIYDLATPEEHDAGKEEPMLLAA